MTTAAEILDQANRTARRESLLEFVKDCNPGYKAGWVHREICTRLEIFIEDLLAGKRPRLMLFMPPRHGKSAISSRAVPAFALTKDPSLEIMVVSYSADLANSFSYDCRDLLKRQWYQDTFPDVRLASDRKGILRWTTTAGGGYNPIGVHGSITGHGADLLIIDDVVKGNAEAQSARDLEKTYDRYKSSIYNRLSPRGGCILLMTRWSDLDLPGRLLAAEADGSGERWDVIKYPAIATHDEEHRKKGEALHPERFPLEILEQIRKVSGPDEWESLYQQEPVPPGGEYVREEWIKRYSPEDILGKSWNHVVISWDTAFKDTVRSDRCAAQVWGMSGGDMYLLHAWAGKLDFNGVCDKAVELGDEWSIDRIDARRVDIVIESRANGMGIIRYLSSVVGLTNVRGFDPQKMGGKEARANIASGYFRAGRIYFPPVSRTMPWVRDTTNELLRFPQGKHDDAVDACTQAIAYFRNMASNTGRTQSFSAGRPVRRDWARTF
jgi:predicted phage terminase large subunit-like protein